MAKERELKWVKEAQEEAEKEAAEMTEEETKAEETEAETGEPESGETKTAEEAPESEGAETEGAETEETAGDSKLLEVQERFQRLFAEFDNFRKRSEKEKAARYDLGAKSVVEKILPVLDSFELALKNVPEGEETSPFVDGMDKIHKQFLKALEDMGVTPIEALGKEFDPAFHNAVMHVEDEEAGENTVVEEFQKGYMYKDQVVRYSMVKVAN